MANLILELRALHAVGCADHELKTGRKIEHTPWSRAADEIERLRAALKPFADLAQNIEREHPGWYHRAFQYVNPQVKMEWLMDARTAVEQGPEK